MKQQIKPLIVGVMLALVVPVVSRAQAPSTPADACTAEAKNALYAKFLANRKGKTAENPTGDQEVAYNTTKEYKALCPADQSAPAEYMAKWGASYEVESRKTQFLSAYDKKNYAEMMRLGKQVLADDPAYVRGYILLGIVGYLASAGGNNSLSAESMPYAKKAIELIESGKTPDDWKPYAGKDDALAWLNSSMAHYLNASPSEALPYLLKAARYEGLFKTNPLTYVSIAQAYEVGYAKQGENYKQYADKPESPEQKLALQNIYQTVDRIIDAYARAIALAGTDPKLQSRKAEWTQSLTDMYKFRNNNSDAGLTQLLSGVLQKPLPDTPTPITTLPTPPAPVQTPTPATPAKP
ncbi:MAG: hypothetical protein H7Z16_04795 [Pyrinomonadaceae bacterium]|nr:hypothetical protein [Pyrinomonadaceae bacterium]